jgi:hypothetical protein
MLLLRNHLHNPLLMINFMFITISVIALLCFNHNTTVHVINDCGDRGGGEVLVFMEFRRGDNGDYDAVNEEVKIRRFYEQGKEIV